MPDPDDDLVAAAKAGSRSAFRDLHQRHIGRVYAHCLRMMADADLAEDVCQEVFIQVWLKLDKFEQKSLFATWLHRVTVNTCISAMRKRKSWMQKLLKLEASHVGPEYHTENNDLHGLDRWIVCLPERARQVFILHCIEGYAHQEIAKMLSTTVGTSKSQYIRARSLLKEWLRESDETRR